MLRWEGEPQDVCLVIQVLHKLYYQRVTFLREYKAPKIESPLDFQRFLAIFRSSIRLGIFGLLPLAITLVIYGYHFRKVCNLHILWATGLNFLKALILIIWAPWKTTKVSIWLESWSKIGFFVKNRSLDDSGIGDSQTMNDEMEGIAWSWQSIDGALVKAPLALEAVGRNPTDRGKREASATY